MSDDGAKGYCGEFVDVGVRRSAHTVHPMRSFDPRAVGTHECKAWETYYRRKWPTFYRLLVASGDAGFDPAHAAELEVEWWRAHREAQHAAGSGATPELVSALRNLYSYSYGAEPKSLELAAALRAEAMMLSDEWVLAGCDPEDPRLQHERALLIRSYAALLAAVRRS